MSTRITGLTITSNQIIINYSNGRYYADGVNPWPGDYGSKVQWMYNCPGSQGVACKNPPVDDIIKDTRVNYISFIQNLSIVAPEDLVIGIPMSSTKANMTDPCYAMAANCTCTSTSCVIYPKGAFMQGQDQKSNGINLQPCQQRQLTLPYTKADLKTLHDAGITLALTLGSWCSRFPRIDEAKLWIDSSNTDSSNTINYKSYKSFLPGAEKFVKNFHFA